MMKNVLQQYVNEKFNVVNGLRILHLMFKLLGILGFLFGMSNYLDLKFGLTITDYGPNETDSDTHFSHSLCHGHQEDTALLWARKLTLIGYNALRFVHFFILVVMLQFPMIPLAIKSSMYDSCCTTLQFLSFLENQHRGDFR